jgi:hypothetical protein
LFALSLTLLGACGSKESTEAAPAQVQQAGADEERSASAQRPARGKHRNKKRRGSRGAELCGELECSPDQRTKIDEIFTRRRGERKPRPDHTEANQALAAAFRGDAFSAEDVNTYREAAKPASDRGAKQLEIMAALHAELTPEQRSTLAGKIETDGFMSGRWRSANEKERRGAEADPETLAKRAQHRAERLCEPVTCTPQQLESVTGILAEAQSKDAETPEPPDARQTLAAAMRSETFDAEALGNQLASSGERRELQPEVLVAIHGALDPAQRETLAAKIEKDGLRALMGRGRPDHRAGKMARRGKGRRN